MADTVDYAPTPASPLFGQPISAAYAQEVAAALRANRIYAGPGIRISRTSDGVVISATGAQSSVAPAAQTGVMPQIGTVLTEDENDVQGTVRVRLANGSSVTAYCVNATYSTRILAGTKVILYPVQVSTIPGVSGEDSGVDVADSDRLFFFRPNFWRGIACDSGSQGRRIFVRQDNALYCLSRTDTIVVYWGDIDPPSSSDIPDQGKNRILHTNALYLSIGTGNALTLQEVYVEGKPAWYAREYGLLWRDGKWIIYRYSSGPNPSAWEDWATGEVTGDGWWESSDLFTEFAPAGVDTSSRDPFIITASLGGDDLVHQGDGAETGTLFGTYVGSNDQIVVGAQEYKDNYRTGRTWYIEDGALRRRGTKVVPMTIGGTNGFGFFDPNLTGVTFFTSALPNKSDVTFNPYTIKDGSYLPAEDVDPLTMTFKGYGPGMQSRTQIIWVCNPVLLQ